MSNITAYPLQDGFETTLAQSWNGAIGTVYLNTAPSFTFPSGVKTYIVVNPGKTNMQVGEIDSLHVGNKTVNVSSISVGSGAGTTYSQESHSVGSTVIISDNYQFWKNIVDAVNSKADTTTVNGQFGDWVFTAGNANSTTNISITQTGSNFRIRKDGNSMKFRDDETAEISLKDLTVGAPADQYFAISSGDTTVGHFEDKVVSGTGITQTKNNSGGNETMTIAVDTATIATQTDLTTAQSSINNKTLVAGETIAAEKLVSIESDGKAYKTRKSLLTPAQIGAITGIDTETGVREVLVEYLTDDKAIVCYKKSADNKIYGTAVSFDRDTITVGAEQVLIATNIPAVAAGFKLAVLSSTLFVVACHKGGATEDYAVASTVNLTTLAITAGAEKLVSDDPGYAENNEIYDITKVNSTTFVICYSEGSSNDLYGNACSISGTTITRGVGKAIDSSVSVNNFIRLCYISDGVVGVYYSLSSPSATQLYQTITISGTTISTGTELTVDGGSATDVGQLILLDNGRLLLSIPTTTGITTKTIDYSSLSVLGTYTIYQRAGATNSIQVKYLGDNKIIISNKSLATIKTRVFEINDYGFIQKTDVSTTATVGGVSVAKLNTIGNKALVVYNDTGTNHLMFSLYNNTENQYLGVSTEAKNATENIIIRKSNEATITGLVAGTPYYVGDAGAVATSGTRQIGTALSTTSLLLN